MRSGTSAGIEKKWLSRFGLERREMGTPGNGMGVAITCTGHIEYLPRGKAGMWRSLVSALDWGSRGRRFKSGHPDQETGGGFIPPLPSNRAG